VKENWINDNHFEKLLKEKADEFVLYPSKKVWYSIYNNMHPSKKWPSITICLVLLTVLFLMGNLHTNNNATHTTITNNKVNTLNNTLNSNISRTITLNTNKNYKVTIATLPNTLGNTITKQNSSQQIATIINNTQAIINNTNKPHTNTALKTKAKAIFSPQINSQNTVAAIKKYATNKNKGINNLKNAIQKTATIKAIVDNNIPSDVVAATTNFIANDEKINTLNTTNNTVDVLIEKENEMAIKVAKKAATIANTNNTVNTNFLSTAEKSWIEHDVLYNSRKAKKWKAKLYIQAYATPSISFRHLNNNTIGKVTANQAAIINQDNTEMNNKASYTPSYGIETGIGFKYTVNKKIKLKSGIQFNFTRYTINAFDNHHPTATSITINDSKTDVPYQVFKSTSFSSKNGVTAINLHNTSYQLSIPIGIDYKIAGNDNIQWYAGATLQPTIVLSGKNHLLSTDYKYFIKDNSLMNRFNLHAGLETYISFTNNGINWQIGPQIRYQLFTTNTSLYNIEEKLTNVGLKIGITKKL
jgi:Outer membrane protein beta-barrel domain